MSSQEEESSSHLLFLIVICVVSVFAFPVIGLALVIND